jgi:hypothetical protein
VTPRTSPNRREVTSVAKLAEREMITTPSASMPTNSRPMPVSSRTRARRVTSDTAPLITSAATNAPMIGLNPHSTARARPGITPWARPSPRNVRPRSTTHVPITAHAAAARMPASSARCMNAGS